MLRIRSKSNLRIQTSISAILGTILISQGAWALPDSRKNSSDLGKFQGYAQKKYPSLSGVTFLEDHEVDNMLYVSPANRKSQGGNYLPLNSTPCDYLKDQYRITYMYPKGSDGQEWVDKALKGPFSPVFDLQFGNSVYYGTILQELAKLVKEVEKIRQDNAPIYGEYVSTEHALKNANLTLVAVKTDLDKFDVKIKDLILQMSSAMSVEEKQEIRDQIVAIREEKAKEMPVLAKAYSKAAREASVARDRFQLAEAAWAPFEVNVKEVEERRVLIENIYNFAVRISQDSFNRAELLLNNFESKVVGVASTGFNVWGTEVADANAALFDFGNTKGTRIVPLPVFNFRTTTLNSITEVKSVDGSGTGLAGGQSTITRVNSGDPTGPLVRDKDFKSTMIEKTQAPLIPLVTSSQYGSGVAAVVVRLGAFCTGKQERTHVKYYLDFNDSKDEIPSFKYEAREKPTFSQAVSINYDYYVKAEPIKVSCTLNVSNFSKYQRSSGTKRSWFSKHSWDDTQRTTVRSNGVDCKVSESPNYLDPIALKQYVDGIEQSMMQEIMAEFILQYSKSYTVEAAITDLPENKNPGTFHRVGASLLTLCKGNSYCVVTSLVLKSVDEIFGNETGATSNIESFNGNIYRNYERESYRVIPGQAVIDVEVSAPKPSIESETFL